jgi:hypothetical protein
LDSNTGDRDNRPRSGISPQTLIIASLASVAASFAVARIWGPGTLLGAAAAPVIVALVSETLRRPMRTATATAWKMPTRGHATAADVPLTEAPATAWRPRWGLALATGLAAFAIVVGVFTVPDLVAGRSITGNGQPTTFFGGSATRKTGKPTTTNPTQTTVTKTAPATSTKTVPATTRTTATTSTRTTATTTSTTPTSTPSTTTAAPTASTTAAAVTTATTPPTAAP